MQITVEHARKFTRIEYIARIGFLAGPNVNFSNLKNYEKMIAETIG